jgi:hypothetical protein
MGNNFVEHHFHWKLHLDGQIIQFVSQEHENLHKMTLTFFFTLKIRTYRNAKFYEEQLCETLLWLEKSVGWSNTRFLPKNMEIRIKRL